MEKNDTNSYDKLIARTDLKILSSDISDDFIGVFDTNYDGTELVHLFDNLKKTNIGFTRNSKTVNKPFLNLEDEVIWMAVNHEKEDSFDMSLSMKVMEKYNQLTALCYNEYIKKFGYLHHIPGHQYTVNLQRTQPGQGYHVWHSEVEALQYTTRYLVTMVYLNTVIEGGETEFKYQHRRVQPKNGRVVIWPSQWTHVHRGNPPLKGNKYIATSWIHYTSI